ncbi:hypothetical protein SAMN03159422_04079 [Agrobacterium fabrum]|uniref:Uncharacterized protein n=1 Tax=Agrobacterium fabrum TaxID=1176649 RepID=A0A7Z7FRU6_9HYPH|nr:hypothetical protein SAMN03159422_04079 [Agrobacterium fabrum]SDK27251.1 hypothetical protein SAMN05428983_4444 [Agrobacterium fabrum]SER81112.1 hypothetical protein SAMN03159504_03762 [Agrobacterium fabrum]
MSEVGSDHMKWPYLVRQPYFSNGSHASPGAGFLEGQISGPVADAMWAIWMHAYFPSFQPKPDEEYYVPRNLRGTNSRVMMRVASADLHGRL